MRRSQCAGTLLALLVLLSSVPRAEAQQTRTIRGRVTAAETGLPIAGVTVAEVGAGGGAAVTSGAAGEFHLRVRRGNTLLVALGLGYGVDTLRVRAGDRETSFRLRQSPLSLEPLRVTARRTFSTASSETLRELDLLLRPRDSSHELLELVPGLVIAQHAGGGKAEQIFLRGFDADHGTDVAVSVDGSPVNMVSHGHGQGYADLHFLVPEVVERVDVRKGPYDARDGDLATAGAITFHTRDRVAEPLASARYGSFGTARALGVVPFGGDATRPGGYLSLAGYASRGPYEAPQGYRRVNLFGKFTSPVSSGAEVVASVSSFRSRWNASGQIPERAVEAGLITRYGAIDPTEGGNTGRHDLSLGLRSRAGGTGGWELRAYATRYDFQLFSNFTFFLNDSIRGDGIEQTDERWMAGVHGGYRRQNSVAGLPGTWSAGGGTRNDFADVVLAAQRSRERLDERVDAGIAQSSGFGYAQQELDMGRLRVQLGVRGDLFRFAVDHRLPHGELAHTSGSEWHGIVSPKLNLAFEAAPAAMLYGNVGTGFHSNDARDVLSAHHTDRVLPRAVGMELGTRVGADWASMAVAVWKLDLQSELVYVGDEGTTEANGRTRRVGIDLEARARIASWLWADLDMNLARGRYRDLPSGSNHIPLAPALTSTGGLTARELGPVEGGIRYRYISARPANEEASVLAEGAGLWELFGSYRLGELRMTATVDNLLGAEWNEAQFDTLSRLRGEPLPASGLHFTPGAPRSLQIGLEYRM